MKGICVVCSNNRPYLDHEGCCFGCRSILNQEAPGISLYNSGTVYDAVKELEDRIPGLFVGATCPLDFSKGNGCSCTTVCKALQKTKKDKHL